jgi:predicted transcriptional regulator
MSLDIQVFTRITRDMEILLDKVAEEQERSKSFVLRKALEMYLQTNSTN